jgi:hypothetical protein
VELRLFKSSDDQFKEHKTHQAHRYNPGHHPNNSQQHLPRSPHRLPNNIEGPIQWLHGLAGTSSRRLTKAKLRQPAEYGHPED